VKKKSLVSSERNTRKRAGQWRRMATCAVERLKFIDAAAGNLALTRLFGRAAPGERVRDHVPRNYGQQTSVISC